MTNKEKVEKWIEALESGEYKQIQRVLHRDGKFCCLGVYGVAVLGFDPDSLTNSGPHTIEANRYKCYEEPDSLFFLGDINFVRMNDIIRMSFKKIASVIKTLPIRPDSDPIDGTRVAGDEERGLTLDFGAKWGYIGHSKRGE